MARYSVRLPDIGEGIAEAESVACHVKVGDRIEEDAQLADMMTDKATVEMESPVSGVVVEIAGEVGDLISIGSTLAVIETDEEVAEEETPAEEAAEEEIEAGTPGAEEATPVKAEVAAPTPAPAPAPASAPEPAPASAKAEADRPVLASPAVRARAKDLGVDLAQVQAEGDRIRHADLDAYLRYSAGQGYIDRKSTRLNSSH